MRSLRQPNLRGFHLLVDRRCSRPRHGEPGVLAFAIDSEVGFVWDDEGPRVATERPRTRREVFAVEPCRLGNRVQLLFFVPEGQSASVNGVDAAPVSVLGVGDEVAVADGWSFVVTWHRDEPVRPARATEVGRTCPLCLLEIPETLTVIVCDCGATYHLQGEEVPESQRLECGLVSSTCARCEAELVREAGYAWLPDGVCVDDTSEVR